MDSHAKDLFRQIVSDAIKGKHYFDKVIETAARLQGYLENAFKPRTLTIEISDDTDFKAAQKEDAKSMPPRFSDGSFRQKGHIYEYRFMHEGKQVSVCGNSEKECYIKRAAVMSGKLARKSAQGLTFETWIWKYFNLFRAPNVGAGAKSDYLTRIKLICEKLGTIPLNKITTEQLQEYINGYGDRPNARHKLTMFLRSCFAKAVAQRHIKYNPCDELAVIRHRDKGYPVLQLADQRKIYESIDDPKYLAFYMLCCCTGMRLGEAVAAEIDIPNKVVYVVNENTATKKHQRQIPILPERIPHIELLPGVTKKGAQLYFTRLFKRIGIKAVPHSFRVTFISCCHFSGIPDKFTQAWAGHSSIVMTLNVYAKLLRKDGTSPILEYIKELKAHLGL